MPIFKIVPFLVIFITRFKCIFITKLAPPRRMGVTPTPTHYILVERLGSIYSTRHNNIQPVINNACIIVISFICIYPIVYR